jgi:hypothetical protein
MSIVSDIKCRFANIDASARSVSAGIAAFLEGRSDGSELLHRLYDHVLDEPIPHSMRSILRESQRQVG